MRKNSVGLVEYSYAGCPPILGVSRVDRPYIPCASVNEETIISLENAKNIESVILHAHWIGYIDLMRVEVNDPGKSNSIIEEFQRTVHRLTKSGKRVFILGPVPMHPENPIIGRAKRQRLEDLFGIHMQESSMTYKSFLESSEKSQILFQSVLGDPRVHIISPSQTLCDYLYETGTCMTRSSQFELYRDSNHLSHTGATYLAPEIVKQLSKIN